MAVQHASAHGSHNIIVQAAGDSIQVQVGLPWLELIPVSSRMRGRPRRDIEILDPAFQAVPLVGREQDIQFLLDWLGSEPKIAVTALVGAGGSGKTRLALELLQRLPNDWQGGFLTAEEAARFIAAKNLSRWSWQKSTLIVVDYAALLADTLSKWLRELADHAPTSHALRILLLERHADPEAGWYHDLADGTWLGGAVRELFSPAQPRRVMPLDQAVQRREVLSAGLRVARELSNTDKTNVSLPEPGVDAWFDQRLADSQWADPLLLLMAAVIAASDGLNRALKLSRLDLAKRLAERERDRVKKSVEDRSAKDLLAHLYACVTLCGGLSLEDAGTVADGEFAALRKLYPGGTGQAVDDLARLLGARDWLPALTPDLLGEALLLVTLGNMGPAVTTRLAPVAPARMAATLIRATLDFALSDERMPLECLQAMVAQVEDDAAALLAIEAAFPNDTIVMRRLALSVTEAIVRALVELAPEADSKTTEIHLPRLWNNLANRQSAMGQRPESLASITEAVWHYRTLADANPAAFLPYLAGSLNNQANRQSGVGQRAEALISIREAVRIRRALAEANPDAFLSHLASSLSNQASRQSDVGQRSEALASIAEALRIRRALTETNPDAFLPDLALLLNNLSNVQSKGGQQPEALVSITEAIRIHRTLAQVKPNAFLPDLAVSLNNLASRQSDMGQRPEALASIAEAVRIRRALAETNPMPSFPIWPSP